MTRCSKFVKHLKHTTGTPDILVKRSKKAEGYIGEEMGVRVSLEESGSAVQFTSVIIDASKGHFDIFPKPVNVEFARNIDPDPEV